MIWREPTSCAPGVPRPGQRAAARDASAALVVRSPRLRILPVLEQLLETLDVAVRHGVQSRQLEDFPARLGQRAVAELGIARAGLYAGADREEWNWLLLLVITFQVLAFVPDDEDHARILLDPVDHARQLRCKPLVPVRDAVVLLVRTVIVVLGILMPVHVVPQVGRDEDVLRQLVVREVLLEETVVWLVMVLAVLVRLTRRVA